jgi:hypothetical protein
MHHPPAGITGDRARIQAIHAHQVLVRSSQVIVDQQACRAVNNAIEHDHLLQCREQLSGRGILAPVKFGGHLAQPGTQPCRRVSPAPGVVQMPPHRSRQLPPRIIQHRADLPQREPKAAQQADPVQPRDVTSRVHPVAGSRPPGRRQQADLISVTGQQASLSANRVNVRLETPSLR